MPPQADLGAQQFWLEQMGRTSALNRWVFSRFAGALGRDILEVGCGTGNFTRLMGESGARVLGIDIESTFVEAARAATRDQPSVRIEQADILECDWSRQFDTVVLLDVIEHLADDVAILGRLRDALVPGGRIVVKVPAMPALYGSLDEVVGHHRRYTRRGLAAALTAAEFVNISQRAFNAPGMLGWWVNGKLLRRQVPPAAQLKTFDALVPLFRAVDRVMPPGVGLSLVAVGERLRHSGAHSAVTD
jgi:SAM-dependent methyltransferase